MQKVKKKNVYIYKKKFPRNMFVYFHFAPVYFHWVWGNNKSGQVRHTPSAPCDQHVRIQECRLGRGGLKTRHKVPKHVGDRARNLQ